MVSILNPPKDALKLLAENIEKFKMIRDSWISSGNLLYADFDGGVYEAAGLFSGKVVMCQYHEPEEKRVMEEIPEIPENEISGSSR